MITATELEMLACFGVEPRLLDAVDVPWYYNRATYEVEVDGLFVSFVLTVSSGDLTINVTRDERRLFAFKAMQVADVIAIDEPGVDAVEIILTEGSWLRMQLRPVFEITQGFATGAEIDPQRRHI